MLNPAPLARQKIAAIDKAIAELAAERSDWKALLDAAERLGDRLAVEDAGEQAAPTASKPVQRVQLVEHTVARVPATKTTKKERVTEIAASALGGGGHRPAKELADLVTAQGIDLGGDPIGYISALLSRDGRFKSERSKGGWTMEIGPSNEEAPPGVDAPAGPDLLDLQPASVKAGTGPTPD